MTYHHSRLFSKNTDVLYSAYLLDNNVDILTKSITFDSFINEACTHTYYRIFQYLIIILNSRCRFFTC